MPEFLAETYAPRDAPGTAARRAAEAALAASQVSGERAPVRLLRAIVVSEEETCFYLYQAPSADAVRTALTRAGLTPERITRAMSVAPPRTAPGRRDQHREQGPSGAPSAGPGQTPSPAAASPLPAGPGTRPQRDGPAGTAQPRPPAGPADTS